MTIPKTLRALLLPLVWLSIQVPARAQQLNGPGFRNQIKEVKVVDIKIEGKNQRGDQNLKASGTILVASREHGPVKLPKAPPMTPHRRKD